MKRYKRRIETILKHIDDLERELYTNYNAREIFEVLEKMSDNNFKFYGISDGLLSVIYDETYNDMELEDYINETHREAFMAYEKVRQSGEYNMITDAYLAAEAAGLSIDQYMLVLKNYNNLKEQFKEYIEI